MDYEARIQRVINHIHSDLGGDMSLDHLADIAAMSRFHWHRVYAGMTGETCAQTVRRLRLHRGASLLATTELPVAKIAHTVGYGSVQSFTRAFTETYGCPPARFRTRGDMVSPLKHPERGNYPMFPVKIIDSPALRLAGLKHKGSYMELARLFEQLANTANSRDLWPQTQGMAALYWDDPKSVPEAELRSLVGLLMRDGAAIPEGMESYEIPAGPLAVMEYTGPYAGMPAAYDYLFGVWLPESGRVPEEHPCFEHYLNDPRQVAPEELRTNIAMRLKA